MMEETRSDCSNTAVASQCRCRRAGDSSLHSLPLPLLPCKVVRKNSITHSNAILPLLNNISKPTMLIAMLALLVANLATCSAHHSVDGDLSWQQVRPSCTNTTMEILNSTVPFVFRSSHLQLYDNYTFNCYGFISTVYFYIHKEPNVCYLIF